MPHTIQNCRMYAVLCSVVLVGLIVGCSPASDSAGTGAIASKASEPTTNEPAPEEPARSETDTAEQSASESEASESEASTDKPSPVFSPLEFAKKTLAESYAARAELGEIKSVTTKRNEGLGHAFAVEGSKQNAIMTLLSITPGGEPSGTLFLDDGRQIPLFMPVLEDSYKSDLGL